MSSAIVLFRYKEEICINIKNFFESIHKTSKNDANKILTDVNSKDNKARITAVKTDYVEINISSTINNSYDFSNSENLKEVLAVLDNILKDEHNEIENNKLYASFIKAKSLTIISIFLGILAMIIDLTLNNIISAHIVCYFAWSLASLSLYITIKYILYDWKRRW